MAQKRTAPRASKKASSGKPSARRTGKPGARARSNWGGARPGAGRKPTGDKAGVSHRARDITGELPVRVVLEMKPGYPALRRADECGAIVGALHAGRERFGFRLAHFAVRDDRLHFLVEANNRRSLSRGMQGLVIRVARALNRLWGKTGKIFADRYASEELATPATVRQALVDLLGRVPGDAAARPPAQASSSAAWFDGFEGKAAAFPGEAAEWPVVPARTALLASGWRKLGRIKRTEAGGR